MLKAGLWDNIVHCRQVAEILRAEAGEADNDGVGDKLNDEGLDIRSIMRGCTSRCVDLYVIAKI